jgi:hypothetical protein
MVLPGRQMDEAGNLLRSNALPEIEDPWMEKYV